MRNNVPKVDGEHLIFKTSIAGVKTRLLVDVKAAIRFEAAGLVENSQQCDVRWLYGIHTGNMQYICDGFKREIIHSCRYMYLCMCVCD